MTAFEIVLVVLGGLILLIAALYLIGMAPSLKKNPMVEKFGLIRLAHRGLYDNIGIPENSLAAFRRSIEYGFGMEMDVHLTKDGQLVVFHDDTLDRICGVPGKVCEKTLAELKELNLLGTEERIPTFEEFLALVDGRVPILIEFKCDGNNYAALCTRIYETLDNYTGPYVMESFDPRAVAWVRKNRPEVGRGQLASRTSGPTAFLRFMMRNLLMNVLARPHFIAFDWNSAKKLPAPVLCRKLFGAAAYEWTVRDEALLLENEKLGISNIFEGFIPEKKKA